MWAGRGRGGGLNQDHLVGNADRCTQCPWVIPASGHTGGADYNLGSARRGRRGCGSFPVKIFGFRNS